MTFWYHVLTTESVSDSHHDRVLVAFLFRAGEQLDRWSVCPLGAEACGARMISFVWLKMIFDHF